ncbi:MAG: hypothetical protein JSS81_15570 [Acidobacteria bacterium]|nr:hypothetical protein [Acidobacteriota bacterium]
MKTIFLTVVLLFSVQLAAAQKSNAPGYRISFAKRSVSVTFRQKTHRLDIYKNIDAARIVRAKILFAAQKAGFRYLVLDVSGWSKAKLDDRQCGAGTESNLLWIKLDTAWKIIEVQSERYESCWASIEPDEGYSVKDGILTAEFMNFRDELNTVLTYDPRTPEKGFRLEKSKFLKQ